MHAHKALDNMCQDHSFDLDGRLLFAVPKKGRIYEQSVSLLKNIGIQYRRGHRVDVALCTNMPVALVFLPASDIALYVAQGRVDIGITGQDIVAEKKVKVDELLRLGYGKCKLCIQAPIKSHITDPRTLVGKRIVTSFTHLAAEYFGKLDPNTPTSVSYVSGSVEAACALGLAEAIVDLVETGETMRAAGLEVVADIMTTEAVLIGNPNSTHKDIIAMLTKRVRGVVTAEQYVMIEYNIPRAHLAQACKITPGHTSPTIQPLEDEAWAAVKCMVPKKGVHEKMDALSDIGATDILVTQIANCRV